MFRFHQGYFSSAIIWIDKMSHRWSLSTIIVYFAISQSLIHHLLHELSVVLVKHCALANKIKTKLKNKLLTLRNWQIPLLESWNMILCVSFLIGFSKSLVSFSHIFITGGSGKNGSTVAVSRHWFFFLLHFVLFFSVFIFSFFFWRYVSFVNKTYFLS